MKFMIAFFVLLMSLSASAHETETYYDRVSLSSSAQRQVNNDTIVATLYAEEEGSEAAQLADLVNKKISWAVDDIKQHADIKLQTNSYTTNPVYRKNKIVGWRVRQSIQIESRNMAKVSEQLGRLQKQLALQGMHFVVSPELKTRTDDELISEALAAFEKRATLVAKQLGRRNYRIVNINISTSGGARQYKTHARAAMMMEADVAAPSIEAGEATVQVNINGSIELE